MKFGPYIKITENRIKPTAEQKQQLVDNITEITCWLLERRVMYYYEAIPSTYAVEDVVDSAGYMVSQHYVEKNEFGVVLYIHGKDGNIHTVNILPESDILEVKKTILKFIEPKKKIQFIDSSNLDAYHQKVLDLSTEYLEKSEESLQAFKALCDKKRV